MTPHPITTAAAELVLQIDAINTHEGRDDRQIVKLVVAAVGKVNDAAAALMAGISPAVAKQRRRPSRTPTEDATDAGPDDDADAVLD